MLCCFFKMNSGNNNNNNNNNNNDEKKRPWYIPPFLFRLSTYPPGSPSTQTQSPNQATSLNTSSLGLGNSSGNNNTANSTNIPIASSNLNNNEGFSTSADASVSSAAITGGGDSDAPLLLSEKVTSKRNRGDNEDELSRLRRELAAERMAKEVAQKEANESKKREREQELRADQEAARREQAESALSSALTFVPTETVNDLLNCAMLPKPLPDTRLRRSISSSKKQKVPNSKGINSINTSTKTESVSVSSVDRTTKTIDYVKLGKREVWSKEEFLHHLHKANDVKMKDNTLMKDNAFLNILLNTLVPIEAMKMVRKTNSWVYNENYVSIIEDEDLVENALDEFSWGVLKSVFYMDILQKYVQQFTILKGFSEWQMMDEKEKKEIKSYEELVKTTNRLQKKKKRWEKKFENPSKKQLENLNTLKQEIEEIAQELSGKPVSVLKDAKTDQFIELVGHTEEQKFVVLVEVKPDAKHPMGKVNQTLGFNSKDLDGFSEADKKMIMNLVESNEKAKGNDVEEEEENDDDGAEDINDSNGDKKQKDKNEFVIEDLHNIEEFKKVYFGNLVEWTTSPFYTLLKGDQQCSLRQVLQYMCVNKIRYSIITTLQKWHFCKLESPTTKGGEATLKVAGPFDACNIDTIQNGFGVWRALLYFILAADDWKFEHPEEEIPTYKELLQNKSQNGNNKPGGGNGSNDTSSSSNAGQKKGGRTLPGASNNKTTTTSSTTTTTGTVAKENAQQSNIINSDENDEADDEDEEDEEDETDEEEVDDDNNHIEEDSKNTTKPYWMGEITLYDLIQNRAMEIGRGRGCYIYLMLFEYNVMVVKCLNYKSPYDRDCDAEAIRMEIVNEERIYEVLHSIQGKCIPKLFYAGEMTAGWVDGIATSFEGHDLDDKDIMIDQPFINNAIEALDKIHSLGVVHGDIALRNILKREEDGKPFIIDFGFARTSEEIRENGENDPKDLMKDERDELKRMLIERLKNQKSSSSMPLSEVAKIEDDEEMTSMIEPKEINIGTRNRKKRHLDELNTGIIS